MEQDELKEKIKEYNSNCKEREIERGLSERKSGREGGGG